MSDQPCKPWQGSRSRGYGMVYVPELRRAVMAHRWVWEQTNGPIPPGMVIMHVCDNKPCVELSHLRLGTQADNLADCVAKGRHREATKTHCAHGHPFDEENTYVWRNQRQCRTCKLAHQREHRHTTWKRPH